ncbi:hypothetical protein AJ80_02325 [Polytolypa hystricis UAMH7299]|uniref:Uncharacterized protein n=1 Tax=Polytolypa hystricis (strain UAMH7299) TaxID=1447883 RepID=A0A2B7YQG0_POLH7|nr:hypothetical protein AJ80_02325 [Polytolypa hystricis UAMH7299]
MSNMSNFLNEIRNQSSPAPQNPNIPAAAKTTYTSLPVDIPPTFLSPLPNPSSTIQVEKINFAASPLPEYSGLYALILDNVLSPDECTTLLRMAEMSAGAHRSDTSVENNGWIPAKVNMGGNYELLATDYRNSDRIIWDSEEIVKRLWARVMQGEGVRECLETLAGEEYACILGNRARDRGEKWVVTEQGINERMRFLKYGAGQYFRRHCDARYVTPDGSQSSHFTIHLYLNDSAQALGIPEPTTTSPNTTDPSADANLNDPQQLIDTDEKPASLIRGGATTFHSRDGRRRLDVDPKTGRVLIFQHTRLVHSGDEVRAGIK